MRNDGAAGQRSEQSVPRRMSGQSVGAPPPFPVLSRSLTAAGSGQALVENSPGSNVTYSGSWSRVTATGNASGDTDERTGSNTATVDFSFTGNAVSFIYGTHSLGSTVRLTLDPGTAYAVVLAEIDQCSATTTWQNLRTFTGLSSGPRTLRVARIGKHKSSSSWTRRHDQTIH